MTVSFHRKFKKKYVCVCCMLDHSLEGLGHLKNIVEMPKKITKYFLNLLLIADIMKISFDALKFRERIAIFD